MLALIVILIISLLFIALFAFVIINRTTFLDIESNVSLVNKTALVTGGSAGIGYQFVLKLAARGCRVIIADVVVNDEIKESIIKETHNSNITLHYVDFSSFGSVRKFSEELKRTEEKIDILVNNVGIALCRDKLTEDGLNLTMQVNYYSHFLITHLLIDLLKKSDHKRILFTSSILSYAHLLHSGDVSSQKIKNLPSRFSFMDYNGSKFLAVIAAKMFSKKLSKLGIICNAYHPGVAKTAIWPNAGEIAKGHSTICQLMFGLFNFLLKVLCGVDARKACSTGVELVISNKFKNMTGQFYGKYFPNFVPRKTNDELFCEKIWKASENVVKLKPEERLE